MSSDTHPNKRAIGAVVGFLVVMEFTSGLTSGWLSPLLPIIGRRFDMTAAGLNQMTAIYFLLIVVLMPIIAKLGDRYGHKKMLLISTISVVIGTLLVATAPSFGWLIAGKFFEAPLGAWLPLEFAIVNQRAGKRAGSAIALLVAALTFGGAVGQFFSGYFGTVAPDFVLWVPFILTAICLPVVSTLVPESTTRFRQRIDWVGASLFGGGLLSLLAGLGYANTWAWTSLPTLGTLIGGAMLLVLWVTSALRIQDPLIDLRVARNSKMLLPVLIALPYGAQFFASMAPISLYSQAGSGIGLGLNSLGAGALLSLSAFASFAGASATSWLVLRIGMRSLLVSGGLMTTIAWTGIALAGSGPIAFAVFIALGGFGSGLLIAGLPVVVVDRAPSHSVGIASALYNTTRISGGSILGAVFTLLLGSFVLTTKVNGVDHVVPNGSAYTVIWLACAASSLLATFLALGIGNPQRPTGQPAISTAELTTKEPA